MNRLLFILMISCLWHMTLAHNHEGILFTPSRPAPSFAPPPQSFQPSFAPVPPQQPFFQSPPQSRQNFPPSFQPQRQFPTPSFFPSSKSFNPMSSLPFLQPFQSGTINKIQSQLFGKPGYLESLQQAAMQQPLLGSPSPSFKFCPFKGTIKCDTLFPYRTFDGSCNNLKNLWFGQADIPYKRLLQPAYADLLNEPRVSVDGSELPNARDIACAMHSEQHEIEPFVNHIFMHWGQFLNHDITSLSVTRDEEKDLGVCSSCSRSEKCTPIMMRPNSTNCGSQMTHPCIEFTRASPAFPDTLCSSPVREQINLQSSYLDGSMIYGLKLEDNLKLRDNSTGRGRLLVQPGLNLLPKDMTKNPSDCLDFTESKRCFRAGDDRVNQNTPLMAMHTIMVREHNRIADILASLNPIWNDEIVFQETRRVIIAMLQHITYNEYLPILLGPRVAGQMGIISGKDQEQTSAYDQNIDPRISNEYASAAGRFGHSMIRSSYSRVNNKYESAGSSPFMLRHAYFRANMIYDECQGGLESVVRGMLKDPVMKVDRFFTNEIKNHLFETGDEFGRPFHFDLISINIQRGRDHGLQGYVKYREFCGLAPIRTWEDMSLFMPVDVVQTFRSIYRFVEDVDLFSALVSEFKQEGALVGPTLACLLGLQYKDIKFGDRFWYETSQFPGAFTPAQLAEIRKFSLSKLLCRTLNNTPKIQPRAMLSSKLKDNELIDCNSLTDINWNFWRV